VVSEVLDVAADGRRRYAIHQDHGGVAVADHPSEKTLRTRHYAGPGYGRAFLGSAAVPKSI
jgi:hypothetical protein